MRIEPVVLRPVAHSRFTKILKVDAKALTVGKLCVIFTMASEVGIKLDAMAHIADQDERRPTMRRRQRAGILLRLPLGVEHQDVPGAARTSASTVSGFVGSE